jgi:hypothetical protein
MLTIILSLAIIYLLTIYILLTVAKRSFNFIKIKPD